MNNCDNLKMTLVQCLKCGYDLRASIDSERCPECGVRLEVMNVPFKARKEPTLRNYLLGRVWLGVTFLLFFSILTIARANGGGRVNVNIFTYGLIVVGVLGAAMFLSHVFIMRRAFTRWPYIFELTSDGVNIKVASPPGTRKERLFHWGDLRHVRRIRGATGAQCIRLGTGRFLRVISLERSFELDCHKAEASLIHAEILNRIENAGK